MSYNLGQIDPDRRTELYADPRDEGSQPQPHRLLTTATALAVMVLFAGGLWFAYVAGTRQAGDAGVSGDVPLIRADSRPDKIKPAQPGGMQIPDRNMLIYGEDSAMVEHLLPPPEKPMPRPVAPPVQSETLPLPVSPPAAALAPPASSLQTAVVAATAPPLPPPVPMPQTKTPPIAAKRDTIRPLTTKSVRLQLGSVRSEDLARSEWERIKRKNPDLLGALSASAIRANLGDKGVYYRIQTEPVGDVAAAGRICSELKERNIGCIIAR